MTHVAGTRLDEPARAALTTVRRFTFNAAADCWPGWSLEAPVIDEETLLISLTIAQRSATLVDKLGLGALQEETARWLVGAFELALRRFPDAASSFFIAWQRACGRAKTNYSAEFSGQVVWNERPKFGKSAGVIRLGCLSHCAVAL
jgi:hypothetical protein